MIHELWEDGDDEGHWTFCLAAPRGDDARALLGPKARLVWTIEAANHFEAITRYYERMGWGVYTTDGRYVVYAHMQKGSVAVRSGDRVKRGTQIGKVGSSGTGGGPHLHMQVTDSPSVIYGDGLPYVFDRFDITGQTPPLAELLPYFDTLAPVPLTTERTGSRHDELPLGQDVITFPKPDTSR